MKKLSRASCVILLLPWLLILPSSSLNYFAYLSEQLLREHPSQKLIDIGLSYKLPAALAVEVKRHPKTSKAWFKWQQELAKTNAQAAFELAGVYHQQSPANQEALTAARYWYQQGARLGEVRAALALANLAYQANNWQQAKNILDELLHLPAAFTLRYELAITTGELDFLQSQWSRLQRLTVDHKQSKALVAAINKYQIFPVQMPKFQPLRMAEPCDLPVQFFATDLPGLQQAEKLINHANRHPYLSQYFCFAEPRYMSVSELDCHHKQDAPIMCDERMFASKNIANEIRFIVLLGDQGQANVNKGIMYLDKADDGQVFEHELLHWLGFVDEYPLAASHQLCLSSQSPDLTRVAVNLLKGELDLSDVHQKQQAARQFGLHLSEHVQLTVANSCDQAKVKTWKPVNNPTLLEDYQLSLPKLYWQLLEQSEGRFYMPSYHYNLAQAYYIASQDKLAAKSLQAALKQENSRSRINRVQKGGF
jgi:hypothetical protein